MTYNQSHVRTRPRLKRSGCVVCVRFKLQPKNSRKRSSRNMCILVYTHGGDCTYVHYRQTRHRYLFHVPSPDQESSLKAERCCPFSPTPPCLPYTPIFYLDCRLSPRKPMEARVCCCSENAPAFCPTHTYVLPPSAVRSVLRFRLCFFT